MFSPDSWALRLPRNWCDAHIKGVISQNVVSDKLRGQLGDETDPDLRLLRETADGDLVITLGAGDVYKMGEGLLALLEESPKADECA